MEAVMDFDPLLEEVDLVYQILKASGEPKKFRDLVAQVFSIKNISADNHQMMAHIHTQLNLDYRFAFLGQGTWGLRAWNQAKVVRREINPGELGQAATRPRRSLQDELEQEDENYQNLETSIANDEEDWEEI